MKEFDFPINSHTKDSLLRYLQSPTGGLVLTGLNGIGKTFIALEISKTIFGKNYTKFVEIIDFSTEKSSIDRIRRIRNELLFKPNSDISKIYILKNFDNLSIPAFNAFLKTLEEPPVDIMFVMTLSDLTKIPITIISRVNVINVLKPEISDLINYFVLEFPQIPKSDIMRITQINSGLPAKSYYSLNDFNKNDEKMIKISKLFLSSKNSKKLKIVNEIYKDKSETVKFLEVISTMANTSILNGSLDNKWVVIHRSSLNAINLINNNVQTRLALLSFVSEIIR